MSDEVMARNENARLRAQVEAVWALHTVVLGSFTTNLAGDVLSEKRRCSCGSDLPCPTRAALSDEGKP